MTLDIYGRQLPAPFAFYDPESSAWRTSRPTLLSDSTRCSLTLPAWGMTRGGALYELRTPGLLTSEPDSSLLLPTPVAHDSGGTPENHLRKKPGRTQVTSLEMIVNYGLIETGGRLLPTPTARDDKGANQRGDATCLHGAVTLLPTPRASDANRSGTHGEGGPDLRTAIQLLPTPRATRGGSSTETMYALGGELSTDHRTQGEVLLPTPTAQDAKDSRNSTVPRPPDSTAHPGDTLTDAVTILVGDRTRQRSDDGKPSSAA